MRGSSSVVGLVLSLVFGCLLLALVAELYYLIWWKKKSTNMETIQESQSSQSRQFLHMFCCKKPSSLITTGLATDTQVHEPQAPSAHQNKPMVRPSDCSRFLFTIAEETKEDMESDDVSKMGSRRSLSDVGSVDTLFFTPLASPPYLTPPTPMDCSYRVFSPLFQSSSDSEFNRIC
ncbi:uncharacterized protein LOC143606930 [Bidens hawaiensis]|uniref:uncharacterized protein LOC143606930 n=1 Tax=Bidens hawaiensis TaxID=980011 RepID=UPI0040493044